MNISNAESIIMEALWDRSPRAAEDITAAVASGQNWSETTVKTLINRLLTKGAIVATKDGRRYLYSPHIARADYVTAQSEGLLDRLFDGRLAPLVSHFSQQQKLTREDLAELRKLIGELDDDL